MKGAKAMMKSKFEQSGDKGMLTLDGDLTVEHAGEMRMALIKALVDSDRVEVKLGEVAEADLACLQLLCSAHRTAVTLKKRFAVAGARPEKFKQAVEAAGYLRFTGCSLGREKGCLWVGK